MTPRDRCTRWPRAGFELAGLTSDTALAAYLALPGQRSFDLADLSLRYLNRELRDAEPASGQLTLDVADDTEVATALAQRAQATAELADALDRDLAERGATELLAEVELPLVRVLADMERAGIAADPTISPTCRPSLGGEVKAAEQAAFAVTGHEFNLGSPKQLQEVLFTELGLPKTKRIKTGYTTDSEALTGPAGADRAPGARAPAAAPGRRQAQEHRGLADPDGGYRRADPHHLQPDDRGHRAAVVDRPQHAEHPDPDRGRPPHPAGLRRRAPATSTC